jgi:hypothetical protein
VKGGLISAMIQVQVVFYLGSLGAQVCLGRGRGRSKRERAEEDSEEVQVVGVGRNLPGRNLPMEGYEIYIVVPSYSY